MYVNTNASYTPTSSSDIGDPTWLPRDLPLQGLGDATLDMVLRLSPQQRAELASIVNRSLFQLGPAQRKRVESGLGLIGPVASVANVASTGITGAEAASSSIFTAANIATAINGLTQIGLGVAQLRLTQMDKKRQEEIAASAADAARRQAEADVQMAAVARSQGSAAAAEGAKWVPWAIGAGSVVTLGLLALFLIRRRRK